MRAVGVRELKNRLSEYLRRVRDGERVLVTDRGIVVAELRPPGALEPPSPYPGLVELVRRGAARVSEPNAPDAYPPLPRRLREGEAQRLLDAVRGER
jgi:antitoxin (DNA-binding transcriptional repressor) of toxin-antitoxin stability system